MTALYKIADEYQETLDNLVDDETGEIKDSCLARLDEIKTSIQEKGIAVGAYIRNMKADIDALAEESKRLARRKEFLEERMEWMQNYLLSNMQRCVISEIKSPFFSVKLRSNPEKVDAFEEKMIPQEYWKRKESFSLDRTAIKAAIHAGTDVPGARLVRDSRVDIR